MASQYLKCKNICKNIFFIFCPELSWKKYRGCAFWNFNWIPDWYHKEILNLYGFVICVKYFLMCHGRSDLNIEFDCRKTVFEHGNGLTYKYQAGCTLTLHLNLLASTPHIGNHSWKWLTNLKWYSSWLTFTFMH